MPITPSPNAAQTSAYWARQTRRIEALQGFQGIRCQVGIGMFSEPELQGPQLAVQGEWC